MNYSEYAKDDMNDYSHQAQVSQAPAGTTYDSPAAPPPPANYGNTTPAGNYNWLTTIRHHHQQPQPQPQQHEPQQQLHHYQQQQQQQQQQLHHYQQQQQQQLHPQEENHAQITGHTYHTAHTHPNPVNGHLLGTSTEPVKVGLSLTGGTPATNQNENANLNTAASTVAMNSNLNATLQFHSSPGGSNVNVNANGPANAGGMGIHTNGIHVSPPSTSVVIGVPASYQNHHPMNVDAWQQQIQTAVALNHNHGLSSPNAASMHGFGGTGGGIEVHAPLAPPLPAADALIPAPVPAGVAAGSVTENVNVKEAPDGSGLLQWHGIPGTVPVTALGDVHRTEANDGLTVTDSAEKNSIVIRAEGETCGDDNGGDDEEDSRHGSGHDNCELEIPTDTNDGEEIDQVVMQHPQQQSKENPDSSMFSSGTSATTDAAEISAEEDGSSANANLVETTKQICKSKPAYKLGRNAHRANAFQARLDEMKKYLSERGFVRIPYRFKFNHSLSLWCDNQRRQYKMRKDGKQSSMTDQREAALNELGFWWGINRRLTTFDDRLEELRRYKEEHGTCVVSRKLNPSLHDWAQYQRTNFYLKQEGAKDANLSDERENKLRSLGFDFSKNVRRTWMEFYEELCEFKSNTGHTCVGHRHRYTNKSLWDWVETQRKAWRNRQLNQPQAMTDDQLELLKKVGFCFTVWEVHFSSMVRYKEKHGNLNVLGSYKGDNRLKAWIDTQRQEYDKWRKGEKCEDLDDEKVLKLVKAGFDFHVISDHVWNVRISELKAFKVKYGSCNVPSNYPINTELAAWVLKVRDEWIIRKRGSKSMFLTDERFQQVLDMNFAFTRKQMQWNDRLMELHEYRKTHCGDSDVPENYSNSSLARWVRRQRMLHKNLQKGDNSNNAENLLSEARLRDLRNEEFQWHNWDQMFYDLMAFKMNHSHVNVPTPYEENEDLSRWVVKQRKYFKMKMEGKPTPLTNEQIRRLDDNDFYWGDDAPSREQKSGWNTNLLCSKKDNSENFDEDVDSLDKESGKSCRNKMPQSGKVIDGHVRDVYTVKISGLSKGTTVKDLSKAVSTKCGTIVKTLKLKTVEGIFKGTMIVIFSQRSSVTKALKLDGKLLIKKKKVKIVKCKESEIHLAEASKNSAAKIRKVTTKKSSGKRKMETSKNIGRSSKKQKFLEKALKSSDKQNKVVKKKHTKERSKVVKKKKFKNILLPGSKCTDVEQVVENNLFDVFETNSSNVQNGTTDIALDRKDNILEGILEERKDNSSANKSAGEEDAMDEIIIDFVKKCKNDNITSEDTAENVEITTVKNAMDKRKNVSDNSSGKRNRKIKNEDLSYILENSNEMLKEERNLNCSADKDNDEVLRNIVDIQYKECQDSFVEKENKDQKFVEDESEESTDLNI